MNKDKSQQLQKADKIIQKHVLWSMAAAAIPVPGIDTITSGFIQIDMLKQLCKLYECNYDHNKGKALLSAVIGTGMSKGVSALFSFEKSIERITFAMMVGATTYALGRMFLSNFEEGIGLIDIDLRKGEQLFNEEFEKGLDYVKDLR